MTQPLTVQQREYGPLMRALNFFASGLQTLGLAGKLEEASILKAAQSRSRLTDLGGDDFRPALREILHHANNANLTALGRINAQQSFIKAASNRLLFTEYFKQHPAVRDAPIRRPIFILGFPRTGTTLLQNLLALNPDRRALQLWELIAPVPVSDDLDEDQRKRLRSAEWILSFAYLLAPEMRYIHEIKATTLEECWPLFFNTFSVMNYDLQASLRGFGDWLMQQDMVKPYQEYRQQLQILSQRQPDADLVLKCPEHLWFIDTLLSVFPDACVVWTHRDPLASVASYCSLISMQHRMLYGGFDPKQLGVHISDRFLIGVKRAMAARDQYPRSEQFFDVDFQQLVADPVTMVRRIHEHFSLTYPETMDADIERWLQGNRSDKRGQHRYSASVYGLDPDEIDRIYAEYIERFSIPRPR